IVSYKLVFARKTNSLPGHLDKLDEVAPYQFAAGSSACETTSISTGLFCETSLNPSCSCTAVNMDGPLDCSAASSGIGGSPDLGRSSTQSILKSKTLVRPVLSRTGRPIKVVKTRAN